MFLMAVTKQLYSLIGFYYRSSVTGNDQIQVILADINSIVAPRWCDPATLDDLLDNPLITKLSVKPLRPILDDECNIDKEKTDELHECFRGAIAEVIQYGPEKSIREWIAQLFGYEIKCPTKGLTSIELVNRVVMKAGRWNDVPQDGMISAEGIEELQPPDYLFATADSKGRVLSMIGSNFKQIKVI